MKQDKNESLLDALIDDRKDEYLAKCEICLLTSILIVSFLGNSLILISLYAKKHQIRKNFTRMYLFVVHLTVADLFNVFFNILPELAWSITFRFQNGATLCKTIKFLQPLGSYAYTYLLITMAIDRYCAISDSLNYCTVTSKRSTIMVYCSWFIAIFLCLPQIFTYSYQEILPNVWDCWTIFESSYEKIYITWYSITVFLLPSIILLYTYIGICINTWKTNAIAEFANIKKYKTTNFLQQNYNFFATKILINTAKQTIILITLYLVTKTPFVGYLLWRTWNRRASSSSIDDPILTIFKLLNNATGCINPWIYLLYNRELRSLLTAYFSRREVYILAYDKDVQQKISKAPP